MKYYELTVLFHPDLEMNLDPAIDKVKKLIESNGGKITKEENDGKKRLAYSINNQEFAISGAGQPDWDFNKIADDQIKAYPEHRACDMTDHVFLHHTRTSVYILQDSRSGNRSNPFP